MLRRERAIALWRGFHRQEGRMGVEREHGVRFGGEILPGGDTRRKVLALPRALAEFPSRHPHEPFVATAL